MAVEITQDALWKLTHNSEEIRLRALDQIESKFARALNHKLQIEFKPTELCKQLFRWFQCQSSSKSSKKVLELLARLLESSYGEEAFQKLGLVRIRTELNKLQKLLHHKPLELQTIDKINEIVLEYEKRTEQQSSSGDLVSLTEKLSITSRDESEKELSGIISDDYEVAWSKPNVADYNSLKAMADVLINGSTPEEKDNVLQYLQITMPDYPAEYMLQSPHLYAKLLHLSDSEEYDKSFQGNIFATLITFLRVLKDSLYKRYKVDGHAASKSKLFPNDSNHFECQPKTQLKISKAMDLLLEKCLLHLECQTISVRKEIILIMRTVTEVLGIVKILHLHIASKFLSTIDRMRSVLLDICNQDECHISIARTKHLWLTYILLEMSEINAKRSQLADQYKLLIPQLLDFPLHIHFPTIFERLKQLIFAEDVTSKQSYEEVQKLKVLLETTIQLLKQEVKEPFQIITRGVIIIPVLDMIGSLKLIKLLFEAILEVIPLFLSEHQVKMQASSLLHKLMQLRSENLRSYVYQRTAIAVKRHFAALMNNETIYRGIQNQQLLSKMVIGVPFNVNIFQQIIYDSFENSSLEVSTNAENIILLLLRSHHFYETTWKTFLQTFLPVLPILQCCTHSRTIKEVLLKLLDPDSKLFPFIAFLRGNIGFMFDNDSNVRSEALTRLIYMLNSLPYSSDYFPNIVEISDLLPNDLCILQIPRHFRQMFIVTESYYELTTLRNLLTLLDTPDIEPQVRKSTLMQLNIMCTNWETVTTFCKEQAHCLVLASLENSLKRDSSTEYVENVIPSISILAKLLICDEDFRHELAGISNVYILLLRALFHFSQNVQLRQDASICLFLLIFDNFLVIPHGGGDVETPKIISNLNVPLKCEFQSASIAADHLNLNIFQNIMSSFLTNEFESNMYIRNIIAYFYLKSDNFSKKEIEQVRGSLDICPSLLIEQRDARFTRATSCFQNMRIVMKSISNATDQKILIKSVNTLGLQLMLHHFECHTLKDLPLELTNALFTHLNKYLQVTPGNSADLQVYACVLDILCLCVRLSSGTIIQQLKNVLRTDFHHGVIIMVKNSELPLDMYLHLSEFLVALLKTYKNEIHAADQIFLNNLFELLHDMTLQFYTNRNLQRARCLLSILKTLTSSRLNLPDQIMYKNGKTFMKLSINVRSTTQTGAQWHRDCLLSFIQIFKQLPDAFKLKISENFLKPMVGLCGHKDMEVRALSWILLTLFANIKEPTDIQTHCLNGTQLITSKLADLPGGFIGCCLSTFLDASESVLVRNFAGNLFMFLLNETCDFQKAILLLERHTFFATAYTSLETCIFDRLFPLHRLFHKIPFDYSSHGADIELVTCETVICYCHICIALIRLQPEFVKELCEKPLLFKIYELLKQPLVPSNEAHYEMCAQICHLYAICSNDNFIFLQRTVCHDDRLLSCLFDLLDPPPNAKEESIVCVLQLTLALCRDEFVFRRLCARLTKNMNILRQLLSRVITIAHINSPLQQCTLSVFIYFLIKAQHDDTEEEDKCNFISALEEEYELPKKTFETANHYSVAETNKENISWNKSLRGKIQRRNNEIGKDDFQSITNEKVSLSKVILLDLYKIFTHFYPCNSCKFDSLPGTKRIQVCETLSLLLKISPNARFVANNIKLLNKILLILETFLREFGNSGTPFIRRHGENKKRAIVKNLKILFQILLHWFSPSAGVLVDEQQCLEVSKIIIRSWGWLEHSLELKFVVFQVCSFLSEHSFIVCGQFSALIPSYSHSILQLVSKVVVTETHKNKTASSMHLPIVAVGLRVMMNCCSSTEGRFTLVKEQVLNVIDSLHPFNMKSSKTRVELLNLWLQFWELFSRYSEGGHSRSLNALCTVINRSTPCSQTRLICLKILRNMCFVQQNRSMLMVSSDFIFTANEIIAQPLSSYLTDPASYEEQLVVCVAIWQLISGGIKFMAMLRGTKMAGNLRNLRKKLLVLQEEESSQFMKLPFAVDLANILEIIFNIFTEN